MSTIEVADPSGSVSSPVLVSDLWKAAFPTEREIRMGHRRLHAKATGILMLGGASYWALVIADYALWIRVIAAALLVGSLIATATGIMHDANHGSFSTHRWFNRLAACSSDLLGASSWLWRFKHNHLHHGNTNVPGFDSDIEQEPFARLSPDQQWRSWHRWQHVYLWFLYGFFAMKNLLFGDLRNLAAHRVGSQELPGATRRSVVARIVLGKVGHIGWALVVPFFFNPWWGVLAFYAVCSWVVGFTLAVVFQLAHCVDVAGFPAVDTPRRGNDFYSHQLLTTVDIASPVPVLGHVFRWLVGGLDCQIEHHLSPRLPHTVYPIVARRFHRLCREAGITVRRHSGVWSAIRSHTRWLIDMGRRPLTA
jgi:linoleoyl-CoA desaturase